MKKKRTGLPKYFVDMAPRCIDQLEGIPKDIRELIMDRIDDLGFDPKPLGFEPLKGAERGLYRIRQGDLPHRIQHPRSKTSGTGRS